MIEITVSRYPADKQGPDIVDPLITSKAGAEARGQGEIDANGYNILLVSGNGPLRDNHIEPGALVESMDLEQQAWRGQVERSAIVITRTKESFSATMAMEIERRSED